MKASGVTLSPTADEPTKLAALLVVLAPVAVAAWVGLGFLLYASV